MNQRMRTKEIKNLRSLATRDFGIFRNQKFMRPCEGFEVCFYGETANEASRRVNIYEPANEGCLGIKNL